MPPSGHPYENAPSATTSFIGFFKRTRKAACEALMRRNLPRSVPEDHDVVSFASARREDQPSALHPWLNAEIRLPPGLAASNKTPRDFAVRRTPVPQGIPDMFGKTEPASRTLLHIDGLRCQFPAISATGSIAQRLPGESQLSLLRINERSQLYAETFDHPFSIHTVSTSPLPATGQLPMLIVLSNQQTIAPHHVCRFGLWRLRWVECRCTPMVCAAAPDRG